jgi:ATP-dependent DNA helicase RecQ
MATGYGKSAIYQIAGLLTNGPTVVVSPLIALQKDQSESIQEQDMAPAAVVNSSVRSSDGRQVFRSPRRRPRIYLSCA